MQECIRALDQTWHPEHFRCAACSVLFDVATSGHGIHSHHGRPYCKQCYIAAVCDKCHRCNRWVLLLTHTVLGTTEVVITYFPRVIPRPITDKALRALDHSWHVACFVCKVITNWTKNIPFKLGKNNSFHTRNVECLLKGRRISTQLTVTQCVESVSVQGRQSEQINFYTRMFVKFRETILVTGECQTNIYRSIILF